MSEPPLPKSEIAPENKRIVGCLGATLIVLAVFVAAVLSSLWPPPIDRAKVPSVLQEDPSLLPATVTLLKDVSATSAGGQEIKLQKGTSIGISSVKDNEAVAHREGRTFTVPLDATNCVDLIIASANKKRDEKSQLEESEREAQKAKDKRPEESEPKVFSLGWLAPKVRVRNGNGEFSYTVPYTYDPKLAGWFIAQYVFKAANKRNDLTQITVVCDLGISDLVDKYGHKVERPYLMGNIVVKDLDEVRRYTDEDAYARQAQYWFGEELKRLDYSEFMAKH